MAEAKRDENFVTTLLAVSSVDGVTPVTLYANPTTHRLLVDLAGGYTNLTQFVDQTAWRVFYSNGSGDVTELALGGAGSYLQSNGAALAPTWVTPAGAGDMVLASVQTVTGAKTFGSPGAVGKLIIAGATSGSTILDATAVAGAGTVTLPTTGTLATLAGNEAFTNKTINGMTVTASTGTFTLTNAKTLAVTNTLTLSGTDSTVMTFPTTSATLARTDAGNTFTGASTASAWVLTSPTITTGIVPTANDGAALGSGTNQFADLFLATGGIINYANGDMLVTHSTGILTISNTAPGATGPILEVYQDSASPAAADTVGTINFYGRDSATNKQLYGSINAAINSPTSGSELSYIDFSAYSGVSATTMRLGVTGLIPLTNDGLALGGSANQFSDLFLATGGVINFNNGNATITHSAGLLTSNVAFTVGTTLSITAGTYEVGAATDTTISRSAAGVIAVEGVVIPSISSTNTLTNKRITKRVTTTNAPGATPSTNTDNMDVMNFTGLAVAITSMTTNLTGTPVDGDLIMFRFTDDGTARAITWGASFAATTVALPTTTVISTMLRVGFQYSGSTWKCIATA